MGTEQAIKVENDITQEEGFDPTQIIEEVQYALFAAKSLAGQKGLGFELGSFTIELNTVAKLQKSGGIKFKIPFVEWEIGGEVTISDEQIQVMKVTLEPKASDTEGLDSLADPLTGALFDLARIVDAGRKDNLGLKEGSIELQLVCERGGEIKVADFAGLKRNKTVTHKLTIVLK